MTEYTTYWMIGAERLDSIEDVAQRVADGAVAREVSAESQAEAARLRSLQEEWHQACLQRHAEITEQEAFRNSAEGKHAAAIRDAAQHGTSRVTLCGPASGPFAELDSYGVSKLR